MYFLKTAKVIVICAGAAFGLYSGVLHPMSNLPLWIRIPYAIIVWPSLSLLCLGLVTSLSMTEQAKVDQKRDQILGEDASCLYRARWLGLWSLDDEAINGLKVSTRFSGEIVPRLKRPELVFSTQVAVSREIEPLARVWRACFNAFIAPKLDGATWTALANNIQGNDRMAMKVAAVEPSPFQTMLTTSLPLSVCKDVEQSANEKAIRVLPQIRLALGQAAAGQGLGVVTGHLDTSSALVHTSYFDVPAIASLMAYRIAETGGAKMQLDLLPEELATWYREQETYCDSGMTIASAEDELGGHSATVIGRHMGVALSAFLRAIGLRS